MIPQLCKSTEAHQTLHLTWANSEVFKLHLNKGVFQTSELPLLALGVKTWFPQGGHPTRHAPSAPQHTPAACALLQPGFAQCPPTHTSPSVSTSPVRPALCVPPLCVPSLGWLPFLLPFSTSPCPFWEMRLVHCTHSLNSLPSSCKRISSLWKWQIQWWLPAPQKQEFVLIIALHP